LRGGFLETETSVTERWGGVERVTTKKGLSIGNAERKVFRPKERADVGGTQIFGDRSRSLEVESMASKSLHF